MLTQFPGVAHIDDEITEVAENFFDARIRWVEREIERRA